MRVPRSPNPRSRRPLAVLAGGALTLSMVAVGVATTAASAAPARPAAAARAASACDLAGGKIKHVIYLQFDNVHYTRDNPPVPSDLQQMPNLLQVAGHVGVVARVVHVVELQVDDVLDLPARQVAGTGRARRRRGPGRHRARRGRGRSNGDHAQRESAARERGE